MRTLSIGIVALLIIPAPLDAQTPSWEVGTRFGITRLWREGGGDTFFRLPGGGMYGEPMLHATYFFPAGDDADGPSVFLDGELLLWAGLDQAGGTFVGLGAQLGYLSSGAGSASPYGAASVALLAREGSNVLAPGAAVGYRFRTVDQAVGEVFGFERQGFVGFQFWGIHVSDAILDVQFVEFLGGVVEFDTFVVDLDLFAGFVVVIEDHLDGSSDECLPNLHR